LGNFTFFHKSLGGLGCRSGRHEGGVSSVRNGRKISLNPPGGFRKKVPRQYKSLFCRISWANLGGRGADSKFVFGRARFHVTGSSIQTEN